MNKTKAASPLKIWYKSNEIAFKLYHLNLEFNQLTPQELQFWKQFKQEDIFERLSGSPIYPPDYNNYVRIHSTILGDAQQEQPPGPQQQQQQEALAQQHVPAAPKQGPSPRKPGRPPGSKNKLKDPLTRAAYSASKRFTRAASKILGAGEIHELTNL